MTQLSPTTGGGNRPLACKPASITTSPLPAEVRAAVEQARALLAEYVASFGPALPPGPVQRQLGACKGRLHDALYHFDRAHQRPDGSPWA